ncbi:hypothetical protein RCL1_004912 [Eukaryota sp. TZLM3-RCL]
MMHSPEVAKSFSCIHHNCGVRYHDFTFVRSIGRGAQGATFLVKNKHGRLFCAKSMIHRFDHSTLPEVSILIKKLSSPFLVKYHHCFVRDEEVVLLMEYAEGGSLHEFFSKKPTLTESDIWSMMTQLLLAVEFLHKNSIIHRDLKPGNILLRSNSRPFRLVLCDFGIAKQIDLQTAKTCVGTELYMAPEVFSDSPYDWKVDMWSLGVIFYMFVEKKLPFSNLQFAFTAPIPSSATDFAPVIESLLVRDSSMRCSATELLDYPQISHQKELLFTDYMALDLFQVREDVASLETRFSLLQAESTQKIDSLVGEIANLKKMCESQQVQLNEQGILVAELRSLLVSIKSKEIVVVDTGEAGLAHAEPDTLLIENDCGPSPIATPSPSLNPAHRRFTSTPLPDVAPIVTKVANNGPLTEQPQPTSRLVVDRKGPNLMVPSPNVVTKISGSRQWLNSFIPVDIKDGRDVIFTLKKTGQNKWFGTFIGFFNPNFAQTSTAVKYFTGLNLFNVETNFISNGIRETAVTDPLTCLDCVIVSFSKDNVVFSVPKNGWSRAVPINSVVNAVFGFSLWISGEYWLVV